MKETTHSLERIVKTRLPTAYGDFQLYLFKDTVTQKEHMAMVKGDIGTSSEPVLTRIHSECLTGEVFGSLRCDCQWQLNNALEQISKRGTGILVYLRQEGRGIGLASKLEAYNLQDQGLDTIEANVKLGFDADLREYRAGAAILEHLHVRNIDLITNNPIKAESLLALGIKISRVIPSHAKYTPENKRYLQTKATQLGHNIPLCTE